MRISFATTTAARAAVTILEQYGFSASQTGKDVVTNCPTLLAAPAIERSIGLELVEGIQFSFVPRATTRCRSPCRLRACLRGSSRPCPNTSRSSRCWSTTRRKATTGCTS
jgi:hypothetical protein